MVKFTFLANFNRQNYNMHSWQYITILCSGKFVTNWCKFVHLIYTFLYDLLTPHWLYNNVYCYLDACIFFQYFSDFFISRTNHIGTNTNSYKILIKLLHVLMRSGWKSNLINRNRHNQEFHIFTITFSDFSTGSTWSCEFASLTNRKMVWKWLLCEPCFVCLWPSDAYI